MEIVFVAIVPKYSNCSTLSNHTAYQHRQMVLPVRSFLQHTAHTRVSQVISTLALFNRICVCISRFALRCKLMSLTMLNSVNYECRHGVYFFQMPPILRLFQRCAVFWKTLYHFGTYVTSVQGQLHCVTVLTYNMVLLITCRVTCAMPYRSANLTTLRNKK
jgi:hypothetical protein